MRLHLQLQRGWIATCECFGTSSSLLLPKAQTLTAQGTARASMRIQNFLQVCFVNKSRIGKISSLPMSMSMDSTTLAKGLKSA